MDFEVISEEIRQATLNEVKALDILFAELSDKMCSKCKTRCCCHRCGDVVGYWRDSYANDLRYKETTPEFLDFLKIYKFQAKRTKTGYGFYRAKTGCSLPRHLRSQVCLEHVCGEAHDGRKNKKIKTEHDISFAGATFQLSLGSLAYELSSVLRNKRAEILKKHLGTK